MSTVLGSERRGQRIVAELSPGQWQAVDDRFGWWPGVYATADEAWSAFEVGFDEAWDRHDAEVK